MIPNPPLSNTDQPMTNYRDLWIKALAHAFGCAPGRSFPDHDLARAEIAADRAEWLVRQSQCARCMEGGPEWREALDGEARKAAHAELRKQVLERLTPEELAALKGGGL